MFLTDKLSIVSGERVVLEHFLMQLIGKNLSNCKITGKLRVFDVSSQIQTDMHVLELRAYKLEFMF